VVRYFGGKKLGVSGLIEAYGTAAEEAIAEVELTKKFITKSITVKSTFDDIQQIMRFTRDSNVSIENQEYTETGAIVTLKIVQSSFPQIQQSIQENYLLEVVE
jgi:putative IMPACT (imprinted ancient) family translation regulator